MKAERAVKILLIGVLIAFFGGCGFGPIEDLLSPPRLTDEQSAIYKALTDSKGSGLKLKYPRTGEHRSAFVLYGEKRDSAIVFYEITGINTERSLRLNFLYKDENNNWESLHDWPITGTDIDNVSFVSLGEDEIEHILLSYIISQNEKGFMVISNFGRTPVMQHGDMYSFMQADYFFGRDRKELLVIKNDGSSVLATFYNFKNNQLFMDAWSYLDPFAGEYVEVMQGEVARGIPALFITHRKSDNTAHYGTDVLHFRGGRLVNPMMINPENAAGTLRMTNSVTELANPRDIDGDGIIKLSSSAREFPGYADLPVNERLRPVIWRVLNGDTLEDAYYSYYSERLDFAFLFPGRWVNEVTVKLNADENTVGFYEAAPSVNDADVLLLKIQAVFKDGGTDYHFDAPDPENPLTLTAEELDFAFRILSEIKNVEE